MSRQKHLRHVALAFVAGGLLTYVCVNLLGHAGTIDAKGASFYQCIPEANPSAGVCTSCQGSEAVLCTLTHMLGLHSLLHDLLMSGVDVALAVPS